MTRALEQGFLLGLDNHINFGIIKMEFTIEFYTDPRRRKPVKEFLEKVFKRNKRLWAQTIKGLEKIKLRDYHKEPLSKALGDSLWEIRIRSRSDILRIIYTFIKGRRIILLHGFVKKTQKTPKGELAIAGKRLKQLTRR